MCASMAHTCFVGMHRIYVCVQEVPVVATWIKTLFALLLRAQAIAMCMQWPPSRINLSLCMST